MTSEQVLAPPDRRRAYGHSALTLADQGCGCSGR